MGDFVIRTGDTLVVTIPGAVIPAIASPVPLAGSSNKMKVGHKPVCLEGDELPESLKIPLAYTTPIHTIPGSGTLTLTPANKTRKTKCEGKAILIKGGDFTAKFDASTNPAKQPGSPPAPDPQPVKSGTVKFVTTNQKTKAG